MEIKTNKNVTLVIGAKNGAFYDFDSGKVYHVNKDGVDIVIDYANGKRSIDNDPYLTKLFENKLISNSFTPVIDKNDYSKPPIKLNMAWLELTEACNLKCVHCYEGECHHKLDNALSVEKWKSIIDELADLNINRIILIGGEPSCYKAHKEIVKYCGEKGLNTTYFTNATMIDDELIQLFKKYNISVKISIYGGSDVVHDTVTTVKGSFERTRNNIIKMNKENIKMYASVILMKENQDDLQNIINFLKQNNVNYTGYDVIRNVFGQKQNIHCPTNMEIVNNRYIVRPSFKADKDTFIKNHFYNSCWYGKIAIKENGDVIPCVFHREDILGNVNANSIVEIINSPKALYYWGYSFDKVNVCNSCEYRYACKDCRVVGFGLDGNLSTKNYRCTYDPYNGEWISIDKKTN